MRCNWSICGLSAIAWPLFLFLVQTRTPAQEPFTQAPNPAVAQQEQQGPENTRGKFIKQAESATTPRLPDGHPDLNGRWTGVQIFCDKSGNCNLAARGDGYVAFVAKDGTIHADRVQRTLSKTDEENEKDGSSCYYFYNQYYDSLQAKANKPPYKSELLAKVADLDLHANELDPHLKCRPNGIPRAGAPNRIMQAAGAVTFLYANEIGNWWRFIPTDGRAHRTDIDPSYFGDSVAHWEGDTLIIDVNNFNDDTWLGSDGWFHTTALHVVERLTRHGNLLNYQATVEDPNVLTKPWVTDSRTLILNTNPEAEIYEMAPCENEDVGHIVNHDHF